MPQITAALQSTLRARTAAVVVCVCVEVSGQLAEARLRCRIESNAPLRASWHVVVNLLEQFENESGQFNRTDFSATFYNILRIRFQLRSLVATFAILERIRYD